MPTQPEKKSTSKKGTATPRRPRSTPRSPLPDPVADEYVSAPQSPAQGAGDDAYAPTAWGGGNGAGGPEDLTMPSGQKALVRRPGLEQLMIEGVLHNMDNLTAMVEERYVKKGRGAKPDNIDIKSVMEDPEALAGIIHTVDRVVCAIVLKPTVVMAPSDPTRRQLGVVYTDSIGLEDKMFLFNFAVGGSRDLERFREESQAVVGSLAVGEPVEHPSE